MALYKSMPAARNQNAPNSQLVSTYTFTLPQPAAKAAIYIIKLPMRSDERDKRLKIIFFI